MAIGFYQKFANEFRMIDFEQGVEGDALPEMIAKIQAKGYVYGHHFAPHDVNSKEIASGKTRLDTARGLGIDFDEVPDIGVEAGIEKGKLFFSKLWINDPGVPAPMGQPMKGVPYWLDAVSQYKEAYDEDKKVYLGKPIHDWSSHPADVHRYAALVEDFMTNDKIWERQDDLMMRNQTQNKRGLNSTK